MKTLLMLILVTLLAGRQAFATIGNIPNTMINAPVSLDCAPAKPCQYATTGLKHCISRINITGRVNAPAKEIISLRPIKMSRDVLLMPQTNQVTVTSGEKGSLSFQSDDGEQWGELQPAPGGRYTGVISVDQDFEFTVTCADKAVGFE